MLKFPCKWQTKKSRYLQFATNPFILQNKTLYHNLALEFSLIQKDPPRGKSQIMYKHRDAIFFTLPTTTSMADTTALQ